MKWSEVIFNLNLFSHLDHNMYLWFRITPAVELESTSYYITCTGSLLMMGFYVMTILFVLKSYMLNFARRDFSHQIRNILIFSSTWYVRGGNVSTLQIPSGSDKKYHASHKDGGNRYGRFKTEYCCDFWKINRNLQKTFWPIIMQKTL